MNIVTRQGFTLVELSIVLVIIGLIIGGVLVGQDLINAASIRATVGQYEQYNAAVNTFRSKYNGIPGDFRNAVASGLTANGDGDGLLEDGTGVNLAIAVSSGELTGFWQHLSEARLVNGSFDGGTADVLGITYPESKLNGMGWTVYNAAGTNYFQLGVVDAVGGNITTADRLTPLQAYNIETKIDDGLPNSGQVIARGGAAPNTAPSNGAGNCVSGTGASDTYQVDLTGFLCQLRLRMN